MAYTSNKKSTELETKTPPIDADVVILGDSADLGRAKGLTWANVKATLKTYFDTLYQVILVSGTNIKTVNSNSLLGSGDVVIPVVTEDQLKTAIVSLSSADILAGFTTPKTLISGPGAGKAIIVETLVYSFTAGTQYVGGGAHQIRYTGDTVDLVNAGASGYRFSSATSFIYSVTPISSGVGTGVACLSNKAVEWSNASGAYTTGTGTAKIFIKYRIITL